MLRPSKVFMLSVAIVCSLRFTLRTVAAQEKTIVEHYKLARLWSSVPEIDFNFGRSGALRHLPSSESIHIVEGFNIGGLPHVAAIHPDFVGELEITTGGVGSENPQSLGTIRKLSIRNGTNTMQGSALTQLGHSSDYDNMQSAVTLGGPVKKDTLWFFFGAASDLQATEPSTESLVLNRQYLTRIDYAPRADDLGTLTYIGTQNSDVAVDDISAQWESKFVDSKAVVRGMAGIHRGVSASTTGRRIAAKLQWEKQLKAHGQHELVNGFAIEHDEIKVHDANENSTDTGRNIAVYLRDKWIVEPNVIVEAGIRYESQTVLGGLHHGEIWAPRVGLLYDWTNEGRSKAFATLRRLHTNTLVDGSAGLQAQTQDEAALGFEYELVPDVAFGANYQGRRSPDSVGGLDALNVTLRSRHAQLAPRNYLFLRSAYTYVKVESEQGNSKSKPHQFDLDGSYTHLFDSHSELTAGISLRTSIGNQVYYKGSLRLSYRRKLRSGRYFSLFAELTNFQNSGAMGVDNQSYLSTLLDGTEAQPAIHIGSRFSL